jgi:tetratricopeptide (TPR) repeat protein
VIARRRAWTLASLLALLATPAAAQDWDVGPQRPNAPSRPRPRVSAPSTPRPARPATPPPPAAPVAGTSARDAAIERLTALALSEPETGLPMLPTLLRMVRARDGSSDQLLATLDARRASAPRGAADLVRAEVLRDAGRFEEAIAALDRSVADRPDRATTWRSLGALHRQLEHPTEARTAYERALALPGARDDRAEILRALMDLSVATGDLTRARAAQRDLATLLPGSASVRRELADLLVARQRWPEAVTELEGVARSLSGDLRVQPAVLRQLGLAQLRAGHPEEAEGTLRRALAGASSSPALERDVYEALAEIHEQRQDLGAWVASLERQPGASAERWAFLGRRYSALGQVDAAVRTLRRALSMRPRDVDLHVALVQALTQAGRVDEALAARRALVAAVPGEVRSAVDLADDLARAGRRADAIATLTTAGRRAGGDAEAHEQIAQALSALGERDLATRETERVVQLDPGDPSALESLGERYWEQGDRPRALSIWQRIRERARTPHDGHRALGEVYARHDLLPEAIASFRAALQSSPGDPAATRLLAQAQEQSHDLTGAVDTWRALIALPSVDADLRGEARARIANLWNLLGVLPAQATRLEAALRTDPSAIEPALDLVEVYARLRRPAELERALQRVVSLRPSDSRAWLATERARSERGDLAGAIEALQRVIAIDPRRGRELYPRLARHALAMHRDAEAVSFAARAVELNPDDAAGHRELGDLYRARGELDRALGAYRRALSLNDRDFESALRLADIYLARGEAAEAVDRLRSVVRRSPDDDLVGRAGRIAVQVAIATHNADALASDLALASAAAPGRAVLRRLQTELFLGWLRPDAEALSDGDASRVDEARQRLRRLSARAVRPLLDALAEPGVERQLLAVRLLGALQTPDAVQSLLGVASRPGVDANTRVESLRAAATCADARAVPSLIAMLRGEDAAAATLAAWALARLQGPAVEPALRAALQRPDAVDAAAMSALALASRRSLSARPLLASVIAREPDGLVRAAAIVAWSALAPTGPEAASALASAGELGPWSRGASLAAMGPLASSQPSLRPRLWSAVYLPAHTAAPSGTSLSDLAVRALARSAHGRPLLDGPAWRDPSLADGAVRMLTSLLRPASPSEDAEAALQRDEALATSALRAALADPAQRPVAIASLDRPSALAPLVEQPLASATPATRSIRARVLASVVPSLIAAWPGLPRASDAPLLRVIGQVDDPAAVAVLRGASSATDPSLRLIAARALATLRAPVESPGTAPPSMARVDVHSRWSDRLLAVESVGRSSDPEATRALTEAALHDPYAWVRRAALRLLRGRPDASVEPTLRQVRDHDPDAALRAEALEALGGR